MISIKIDCFMLQLKQKIEKVKTKITLAQQRQVSYFSGQQPSSSCLVIPKYLALMALACQHVLLPQVAGRSGLQVVPLKYMLQPRTDIHHLTLNGQESELNPLPNHWENQVMVKTFHA